MSLNQLAQPLTVLGLVYVGRSIDWELNDRVMYLRAAYGVSCFLVFGCLAYIRMKIEASKEGKEKTIKVPVTPSISNPQPEKNAKEELTINEYDLREWRSLLSSNGFTILMLVVFHWKWAAIIPLFLQSFLSPQRLFEAPLFQAHVLGKQLKRPFPKPKGIMDQFKQQLEDANRQANETTKKIK